MAKDEDDPQLEADRQLLAAASPAERSMVALMLRADPTRDLGAALAAAAELQPRDAVEARLAALLVMLAEAAGQELTLGRKLAILRARASALGMAERLAGRALQAADALARHRRPAEQRIVVERVMVAEGGQAVVGMVGVGAGGENAGQALARVVADAHEPTLRCSVPADRAAVPTGGDDERALPDARRRLARGT
jgi:hypothetical protein